MTKVFIRKYSVRDLTCCATNHNASPASPEISNAVHGHTALVPPSGLLRNLEDTPLMLHVGSCSPETFKGNQEDISNRQSQVKV